MGKGLIRYQENTKTTMLTCNQPQCNAATTLKNTTERETINAVVEHYECEHGHTSHETIEL